MLLLPNGAPATRKHETLSRDEIALVTNFERWCERRGLKMDLFCQQCYDDGINPRCSGDNDPDALTFKISCSHADRVYGNAQSLRQ